MVLEASWRRTQRQCRHRMLCAAKSYCKLLEMMVLAPQAGFEPATLRLTEPCHRVGRCGSALFIEGFVTGDARGGGGNCCVLGHPVSVCLNVGVIRPRCPRHLESGVCS